MKLGPGDNTIKKFVVNLLTLFSKLNHFIVLKKIFHNYETVKLMQDSEYIYSKKGFIGSAPE
jgi:hypothetical protein